MLSSPRCWEEIYRLHVLRIAEKHIKYIEDTYIPNDTKEDYDGGKEKSKE